MNKKLMFFTFLFLILALCSFSLELNNGRIKLVLHKNSGRFSIYYLSDPEKRKYTSFFLDQDVRTSLLSVVANNKIYRLGESGSFKEKIEETAEGARFVWESQQLEITEEFTFVTSSGANQADGVLISLSLKNITDSSINVGVRYLFDTYLGESHNHHFETNLHDNMKNETVIEKDSMITYWLSRNIKDENVGLQMVTSGGNSTKPDKIIFANWKRLNETTWTYLSSDSRDFSSRPYSINDSAVCHYYNPVSLGSGKQRKISLLLGNMKEEGFATDETLPFDDEIFTLEPDEELQNQIKSDINVLESLLLMINKKIKSGDAVTDKDIAIMEEILDEIKTRIKNYEDE